MEMNGATVINRPVDTVFAYVIDVANDVQWRTGIDGSRLRSSESLEVGTIGYSWARDKEIEWRVEAYVPGERIEWELLDGPFLGRGGYLVQAVNGGTKFTLLAEIEPAGIYKLLGPLFAWMGRRRNQADVEKLRNNLESAPAGQESP